MINLFKNLFKKEEPFDPDAKFSVNVFSIETGNFLGTKEMTYDEYKLRVTFDTRNRYSRAEKE